MHALYVKLLELLFHLKVYAGPVGMHAICSFFGFLVYVQAYHRGIRYPEYVVLTLGRFRRNWWRQEISGLTCTADQRESVMLSSLAFTESYFLNEVKDANVTATSGIVRIRCLIL